MSNTKRTILVLLTVFLSAVLSLPMSAHRHQRDTVMINGAKCTIADHPLGHLDSLNYCRIADALDFKSCISFGNWNGYVANLAVDRGRLYLTQIRTFDNKSHSYDPKDYLKNFVDKSGRVFVSWFSGDLECAKGETLYYSKDGIHDIGEVTIRLTIRSGVVVSSQEFVNLKHRGKNTIQDFSKDIKAFPGEKFSQTARVFVTPFPAKFASNGAVKEWNFKLNSQVELSPETEKELVRELNRMLSKYDFDTYRDCGKWTIQPESFLFSVGIGKPSNKK